MQILRSIVCTLLPMLACAICACESRTDTELEDRISNTLDEIDRQLTTKETEYTQPETRSLLSALRRSDAHTLQNEELVSAYVYGPTGNKILRITWIGATPSADGVRILDGEQTRLQDLPYDSVIIEHNLENSDRYVVYEGSFRVEHDYPELWESILSDKDCTVLLMRDGETMSSAVSIYPTEHSQP